MSDLAMEYLRIRRCSGSNESHSSASSADRCRAAGLSAEAEKREASAGRCSYRSRRPQGLDDCVLFDEERLKKNTAKESGFSLVTPESDTTEATRAPSSVGSMASLELGVDEVEGIHSPRPSSKVGLLGRSPCPRDRHKCVACRAAILGRPAIPVYGTLVQL
eukprot:TRINITY_DN36766_c0_g1_i1.p1 TRINITY_DN36766_c0_g1~~TRINITY_DN36766_c0_g1_i1.p1  ORF type:complete len:162 (-),score=15.62 TRINITY_DN36766_c0_g1_i1:352-837(-)